jgi:membrane protein
VTHGASEQSSLLAPLNLPARAARLLVRAARGIRAERVQVRAMALTYISLFALVPALVVAFSVIQAFTGMERISGAIHEFLLQNLAVGARASIEPYLDRFVRNAHMARAGVVGGALLLWSAFTLFSHVERAVNDLWEVPRPRSLRRQALVYWMGLSLGPILLAGSATVSQLAQAYLESRGTRFLAFSAAALLSSISLSALYLVVPNAKVRLSAAVGGGLAAGVAWEVAKWLFALFVARFVRYSAIYGSVAAVPIFLTWLYLSWGIVLFGARLAFVIQHAPEVIAGAPGLSTPAGRELLAAQALVAVARAFQEGAPAPAPERLARQLRGGPELLLALDRMGRAGLLKRLASGGLVPARAPETITLLHVRRALAGEVEALDRWGGAVGAAFRQAGELADERLRTATLRDLCQASLASETLAERADTPPLGRAPGPLPPTGK